MTTENPIMEIVHVRETLKGLARHCDQNGARPWRMG
jgi:hypothetical protein